MFGHHFAPGRFYFLPQSVLQRRSHDHPPDCLAGRGQRRHVVDVEVRQPRIDALGQAGFAVIAVVQEVPVGQRGRCETAGYTNAELRQVADHLAERGVLAANLFNVVHSEFL